MKSRLLAAVAIGAVFLVAPASAQVKIGILNDQSRVYADSGGKYSLEAARMAVEDFGGEVLGQKIEIVTADHQNKPDLATNRAAYDFWRDKTRARIKDPALAEMLAPTEVGCSMKLIAHDPRDQM